MIEVASHSSSAAVSPHAIWRYYEQADLWPQWDKSMAWAKIDGPFLAGSTGVMKSKMGFRTSFSILTVKPDHEFTSRIKLPGCAVYVYHDIQPATNGQTKLTHRIALDGLLQRLYAFMFSEKFLQGGVERILQLADKTQPEE